MRWRKVKSTGRLYPSARLGNIYVYILCNIIWGRRDNERQNNDTLFSAAYNKSV